MSTEQKLLPCPFCECRMTLITGHEDIRGLGNHGKRCPFRDVDVILDSAEAWNTRAAQPQAAEGLPEPVGYVKDCNSQYPSFKKRLDEGNIPEFWDAVAKIKDFMPHVNARDARIAELEAELKQTAATAFERIDKCIELEAQLAKGKEGLPEPIAYARDWFANGEKPAKVKNENGRWVWPPKFKLVELTPKRALRSDVGLLSAEQVTPAFAALGADNERLRVELATARDEDVKWRGLREQEAEIDTLRAELAEVVGVLRWVRATENISPDEAQRLDAILSKHGEQL